MIDSGSGKAGGLSDGDRPTSWNPSRSRPDPWWGRAFGDQDAELAVAALPPPDAPEDEPEDDPEEDDDPEDPDPEDEDEDPEEDDELSAEDDSDFAGLVVVPPAVVSEPDARESVR
ncbi:hypothetical protein AB0B68_19995 [Micromonospora sp. NPDC049049]|uniref:hypothetical protein n=1 Tax=Micromonospora sp. NPDC049049 TaxID=3155495 RepID=UPI0033C576D7